MAEGLRGPDRRIVLVGLSGNGKSATGNTILGGNVFELKLSPTSGTQTCRKEETRWKGRTIVVVDTPGFLNPKHSEWENTAEVSKCTSFCPPGPHVILRVIRPGHFSQEEEAASQLIWEVFSSKASYYMILLFTHKDDLEGKPLEEFISEGDDSLRELVAQCGNQYLAFDNKAEGAEREAQVDKLMTMIDELVWKNIDAPCYTEVILKNDDEQYERKNDASCLVA